MPILEDDHVIRRLAAGLEHLQSQIDDQLRKEGERNRRWLTVYSLH
jgi:hypothetical protein